MPRVLLAVDHTPVLRSRLHLLGVVDQGVRPPLDGDAVVDAVHRVVRRGLELRQELLPARDQIDVDRLDVMRVDQPQARVARSRDEVVLAASAAAVRVHEREHLLRGAGVLAVDDAAGLVLELLRERRVGVRIPLDHVELAFAFADRRRQAAPGLDGRRRHGERRGDCDHDADSEDVSRANPPHVPSFSISYVCSGRHERRTRFPWSERASCEDVSRFWRTTDNVPPPSSSTA